MLSAAAAYGGQEWTDAAKHSVGPLLVSEWRGKTGSLANDVGRDRNRQTKVGQGMYVTGYKEQTVLEVLHRRRSHEENKLVLDPPSPATLVSYSHAFHINVRCLTHARAVLRKKL